MTEAGIVFSCVANSSGIIVSGPGESDNMNYIAERQLENIDFIVDHQKSLAGHATTRYLYYSNFKLTNMNTSDIQFNTLWKMKFVICLVHLEISL